MQVKFALFYGLQYFLINFQTVAETLSSGSSQAILFILLQPAKRNTLLIKYLLEIVLQYQIIS
jgi:hypothetical protein